MIKNLYARLVLWLIAPASPRREASAATASDATRAAQTMAELQTSPADEKAISFHREEDGNVHVGIGKQVSTRVVILLEPFPGIATAGWEVVRADVRQLDVTSLVQLSMSNGLKALQSPAVPPVSLSAFSHQKRMACHRDELGRNLQSTVEAPMPATQNRGKPLGSQPSQQ